MGRGLQVGGAYGQGGVCGWVGLAGGAGFTRGEGRGAWECRGAAAQATSLDPGPRLPVFVFVDTRKAFVRRRLWPRSLPHE